VTVSRRQLLGGVAAAGVSAAIGGSCSSGHEAVLSDDVDSSDFGYTPPSQPPPAGIQRYLTKDETTTLDALVARILPGSAEDPGAREASTSTFIDAMLADFQTFDEPTYFQGPFAGQSSPLLPPGTDQLTKEELKRYGFQGSKPPQQVYRLGLAALETYARATFGAGFAELPEANQDTIVGALADGTATGFDEPSAADFFDRVREDTIHATFADPIYGGNRDMIGWKLIGYLGAQRAWTPVELQRGPNPSRPYQGLMDMHHSHPGRPGRGAIHPVQEPDPAVHL
jgi:gluconate 2-dehydrogenase gamma chain